MSRLATVEVHKEELKFSAGHFMLFSATARETMHGHDYSVSAAFDCVVGSNGMSFDCRYYKDKLLNICKKLDYRFILPAHSEFLTVEETNEQWITRMGAETITFLKKDALVLPIVNVTLEELSNWFLEQLVLDETELKSHKIHGITVKIFNGRGESGATSWLDVTSA